MAIYIIPTFDDPFYTQTTSLDGVQYLLEFRYNQRENSWYLNVSLDDATPLVKGVKIVLGSDLLGRFVDRRMPTGRLVAIANGEDDSTPGMGELGVDRRVTLVYLDAAEVAAL